MHGHRLRAGRAQGADGHEDVKDAGVPADHIGEREVLDICVPGSGEGPSPRPHGQLHGRWARLESDSLDERAVNGAGQLAPWQAPKAKRRAPPSENAGCGPPEQGGGGLIPAGHDPEGVDDERRIADRFGSDHAQTGGPIKCLSTAR